MHTPDISFLTRSLHQFIAAFGSGFTNLQSTINALLATLVVIELALAGFWWALGGGAELGAVIKKLLYMTFWIYLVQEFPTLAKAFVTSLVQAGLTAGGGTITVSQILDPSALVGAGLDATEPLAQKLGEMGTFDLADTLIFGLGYLTIMICFVIMAVNLFLTVLEYYLFTGIVGILLPFGILPSTKFLAEKAIAAVVSCGIKLMVLSFVTSAVIPLVVSTRFPATGEDWNMNALWAAELTMVGVTALCWKAPGLAASLMSGSPSLGADHALALVQTAVGSTTGAALGAAGIATGNPTLALNSATRLAAVVTSSLSSSASAPPSIPAATPTLVRSLAS
jgi:type IV secretion system protein TrbL